VPDAFQLSIFINLRLKIPCSAASYGKNENGHFLFPENKTFPAVRLELLQIFENMIY
jgi:hypothetical protein